MSGDSAVRRGSARTRISIAVLAFAVALMACAIGARGANASFNITDYQLVPSITQAASHPSTHYHVDPDATLADGSNGDDIKKAVIDYPAGALANPEAATPKCTSTQFSTDKCPSSSYIGSISTKYRVKIGSSYTTVTAPGSVYILTPNTPGSAVTVGFIVRPPGYRVIFLKNEVTGIVGVRTGVDADYGLTLSVDNIPRTITTTGGTAVNATISDISVDINAKTNTSKTGKFFNVLPSRCAAIKSRLAATSYAGVVQTLDQKNAVTTTGCSKVPFTPTATVTPNSTVAFAQTGWTATFGVPTTDTTVSGVPIQQSNVKNISVDLPTGTGLSFPAIAAIPALCNDAQLNVDACPSGSKIGTASANVPFLPPTMTGDIYLRSRSNIITFGYVLRSSSTGLKVALKGEARVVDIDSDGSADLVRASAFDMPQALWGSATLNFTSALATNPNCGPGIVKSVLEPYSGTTAVTKTNTVTFTPPPSGCGDPPPPPIVTITSPVNGSTTSSATVPVVYTVTGGSPGQPVCSIPSGSNVSLVIGLNTIVVTCTDSAGGVGTATVQVTRTPPLVVAITSPANNANVTSPVNVGYTVNGGGAIPASTTCTVNGAASSTATNNSIVLPPGPATITVTCTGPSGSASASVNIIVGVPPVVAITSPANGQAVSASSVNVSYTVDGVAAIPASGTTCAVNGAPSSSATTNTVALTPGNNSIVVSCVNPFGTGSAAVTVIPGVPPSLAITSPLNGTNVTSPFNVAYTVNGTTTIPAGTTCTLNGTSSTSATTNSRSAPNGPYTVVLACTNAFGNSVASVNVTVGTPPVVAITSPANGSTPTTSPINVAYTVNGVASIPVATSCTVNGTASSSATTNAVAIFPGSNTITVSCTNVFGTGSASVTVGPGNGPPIVAITSPANGSSSVSSPINVAYTVNGITTIPAGTTCVVNGQASTSTTTNSRAIVAGPNTITVSCTNTFGTGSATLTVTGVAPTVQITSPSSGNVPNASPINVTFLVNGSTTIPVGTSCTVNGTGTFNTQTNPVPLLVGANTITVTCTSALGSGTFSVTVIPVDGPHPVITAPVNGSGTTASSTNVVFTLTGGTTIPAGTSCTVNGVATNSTTTNPVSLVMGPNTITVACTDALGTGSATVTVQKGVPPVVAITAPASGANVVNPVNIAYTVNGASSAPPGTTCTVNGTASASATTNARTLVNGPNNVTVSCTNLFGTGTDTRTVNVGTPPVVVITSPSNLTPPVTNPVNVAYTVDGVASIPAGTTCTVNGTASTSATTNSLMLTAGSGINVTCTNAFGSGSANLTAPFDPPPAVTITAPANGSVVTSTTFNVAYLVNGSTTIPAGTTCTVNGVASTSATTNTVNRAIGATNVTVACTNTFGTGSASITVFPPEPPAIVITSPANNANVVTSPVNVSYTINGVSTIPAGMTCTVNGSSSTNPSTNAVTLVSGANSITVVCTNAFGSGSTSINVNFGGQNLSITSPANNSNTASATTNVSYLLNGSTSIPAGWVCTVNGLASTSGTTNSVNLAIGQNTITVVCTSSTGSLSANIVVTRGVPPVVSITAPANASVFSTNPVNVAYLVNGGSTIPAGTTCTVNGAASTSTSVNSVVVPSGNTTITVACTNQFGTGNSAVTMVLVPPLAIQITSPANGANIAVNPTNVSYTINGGTTIPAGTTCTVNGSASTSTTTNPVTLIRGANTITVTCTNAGGPWSSNVSVNYTEPPPGLVITSPANGMNTSASVINVAFTIATASTIPAATTCTVNGNPTTSATTNAVPLALGANLITVVCTNAFGSDTASVTVNRGNPPAVAIVSVTQPVPGGPITVVFSVNGSSTIPSGTTCTVNGVLTNSTTVVLPGTTTSIVVSCTNSFGSGSAVATITPVVPPNVVITSPADGSTVPTSPVNVTYTVNGANAIPAGTTCTVNGSVSTSAATNSVALAAGANDLTVACTNPYGTSSRTVHVFYSPPPPPNTSITTFASPSASTSSAAQTVAFTGVGTSFECRIDSGTWSACTSPWTLPLAGLASPATHTYSVRALSGAAVDPTPEQGSIWVDDRTWNATASATATGNSVTPAANAYDAGRHPNISATVNLEGYDDPQSVSIKFPDGLMGSIAAVPAPARCSVTQANAGTCPASSDIGDVSGVGTSARDGDITATGDLYIVDANDASIADDTAAAVAVKLTLPNGLGEVRALGNIKIPFLESGRNVQLEATSIPRSTDPATAVETRASALRFHMRSVTAVVSGDKGATPDPATSRPLITNPHYCGTSFTNGGWTHATQHQFVGSGAGYNGSTISNVTAAYPTTNCANTAFAPALTMSTTSTQPGETVGLTADLTLPDEAAATPNATIGRAIVQLPPHIAVYFPGLGSSTQQCAPTKLRPNQLPSAGFQFFDKDGIAGGSPTPCPATSLVGTATIKTPLTTDPIIGQIYLINKSPIPNLGIWIDPSIAPTNPKGVKVGLVGKTAVVESISDPSFMSLTVTFDSLPDLPITSLKIEIGDNPNRGALGQYVLVNASSDDPACLPNSLDPRPSLPAITRMRPWTTITSDAQMGAWSGNTLLNLTAADTELQNDLPITGCA